MVSKVPVKSCTAILGTSQFALLQPFHVLSLMLSSPQNIAPGGFELSKHDMDLFQVLRGSLSAILNAVKELGKRKAKDSDV